MYFFNYVVLEITNFFYNFFCNLATFLPFSYVLEHANRQQYCYIGIFLCFFWEFFQIP